MTNAKHNNPPDPIEEIAALHADAIEESAHWTDGELVENEGQMKAVDLLTKQMKAAVKDAKAGQKSESAPHFDAHKAAIARWKPTVEDMQRIVDCLVAANAPFKATKLAEQKAQERVEWEKVNKARLEVERLAREANASDIEAQREVEAAKQAAIDAENAAKATGKAKVKGMRWVHHYEITDHRAALHFIAANHKDDMTAFIDEWVRKNHKAVDIDGVDQSKSQEAY